MEVTFHLYLVLTKEVEKNPQKNLFFFILVLNKTDFARVNVF